MPPAPESTASATRPGPRRRRDALSLREKARIIRMLQESGQSRRALAKSLDIPRATMHSIWKHKDEILSMSNTLPDKTLDQMKRCRPPQYPELEDKVYAFCLFVRSHRKPTTKSLIIAKARKLASELGITGFAASNGWYAKFLRRRGLPVRSRAKAGETDEASIQSQLTHIREQLVQFDPHNIYTVEESRFLHLCLPNRAFLSGAETGRGASAVAHITDNPRITFNVCVNATATQILPLMFVGKEKRPLSFDLADANDAVEDHYFSQPNAWMDAVLFERWLRGWYDVVRTTSAPPWALVIDSSDANCKLPTLPGVTYITLPMSSTAKYQPLNSGIMTAVKIRARKQLLHAIIRALEADESFLSVANTLRDGTAGVVYGKKPTVLDAMRFLTTGLRELRCSEIAKCWLQAGILPTVHENVLNDIASRDASPETNDGMEINALLNKLSEAIEHHIHRRDFEREFGRFDILPADTVDRWVDYLRTNEEDQKCASGAIGDTQEEILAASEAAERAAVSRESQLPSTEENDVIPQERTAVQRRQATYASAAAAVKIVQTALNEVSLHSTNHRVLGKLAEALRLATEDRNEKKARLDLLENSAVQL